LGLVALCGTAESVASQTFLQIAGDGKHHGKQGRATIAVLEPPAYYAHAFHGAVSERVLPIGQARAACAQHGVRADACSWLSKGTCHAVLPSAGAPVRNLAAYRRHELAHCNGWNH
jgi:hypothetical protein